MKPQMQFVSVIIELRLLERGESCICPVQEKIRGCQEELEIPPFLQEWECRAKECEECEKV